jgi:hypothetical protein
MTERHHPEMQAHVVSIEYDWVSRIGKVHVVDGDCTDMCGCISVFEAIDPQVFWIAVFSGGDLDIVYAFRGGCWGSSKSPGEGFHVTGIGRGDAAKAVAKVRATFAA